MRVDEAVVISLPERESRRRLLLASKPNPWPFPALTVAPGVLEEPPPWFKSSAGAWGCRQAHLNVLRSAWERGVGSTLILEDDATFAAAFTERWASTASRIPRDWSMVMLGGEHIEEPKPVGKHVVRCINTRRTHAYIIQLRAIPLLMRIWSATPRHIDHALTQFQAAARVYAPATFLVGQAAGWSDISRRSNPDTRFWITS